MKSCLRAFLGSALLWTGFVSPVCAADNVGDINIVVAAYCSSSVSDGGSSSSSGSTALLERIVGKTESGLIIEYDLPPDSTQEERDRQWQLPARILKTADGGSTLLNADELEARVDPWLESAGWTREICGRTIFTWNAFTISCEPQAALAAIGQYDLRPASLQDGYVLEIEGALEPVQLKPMFALERPDVFSAIVHLDPEFLKRERAATDVTVGEISGEVVTLEEALRQREDEQWAGTKVITLVTDTAGSIVKKIITTTVVITLPDGETETDTNLRIIRRIAIPSEGK